METWICSECGVEFQRYRSQVRSPEHVTCSRKCYGQSRAHRFAGSTNPFYGKHHSEKTKQVLRERDAAWARTPEFRETMRRLAPHNLKKSMGRGYYQVWVEKFGEDGAQDRETQRRSRLGQAMSGKNNPMYGKPSPPGAGNGWKGWYKGWFFRSLHELAYMVNVIEHKGLRWESAERSGLTIPYVDPLGIERTYRADFLIEGKTLVEIKPQRLIDTPLVQAKATAARLFCERRGLDYQVVCQDRLPVATLRRLVEEGLVMFQTKYLAKYEEYIKRHAA